MKKFLDAVGIAGMLLLMIGISTLDSEGTAWNISVVMSIVGVILLYIWMKTEGEQWK